MKKNLILFATALALLSACNDNNLEEASLLANEGYVLDPEMGYGSSEGGELNSAMITTVNATLASEEGRMENFTWEDGDALTILCTSDDEMGVKKYTYNNTRGGGNGPFTNEEGFELMEDETATFVAIYPYYEGEFPIELTTTDQTIEGHKAMDILFGDEIEATYENPELSFTMEHLLTQVSLSFALTDDIDFDDIESITIKGVVINGTFDPMTGEITNDEELGDITIPIEDYTGNVILIPQDLEGGLEIEITLKDGKRITGTLEIGDGTLQPGYSYRFPTVEVSEDEITSESEPSVSMEWNEDLEPGSKEALCGDNIIENDGNNDGDGEEEEEDEEGDIEEDEPIEDEEEETDVTKIEGGYDDVLNISKELVRDAHFKNCEYIGTVASTYDYMVDYEMDLGEEKAFLPRIYTKESVVGRVESSLEWAVESEDYDYAVMDRDGGLFLFNIEGDNEVTAVAWLDNNGLPYYENIAIARSIVERESDGTYSYISMVIDCYDGEVGDMADYVYTRSFYRGQQAEGWKITMESDYDYHVSGTNQYLWSDEKNRELMEYLQIDEFTHEALHNAGWWGTIFDEDGVTPVENGYYNYKKPGDTRVGWFLDCDGKIERDATADDYKWGLFEYTTVRSASIYLMRYSYLIASSDEYHTEGTFRFVYTNGYDMVVVELPWNLQE